VTAGTRAGLASTAPPRPVPLPAGQASERWWARLLPGELTSSPPGPIRSRAGLGERIAPEKGPWEKMRRPWRPSLGAPAVRLGGCGRIPAKCPGVEASVPAGKPSTAGIPSPANGFRPNWGAWRGAAETTPKWNEAYGNVVSRRWPAGCRWVAYRRGGPAERGAVRGSPGCWWPPDDGEAMAGPSAASRALNPTTGRRLGGAEHLAPGRRSRPDRGLVERGPCRFWAPDISVAWPFARRRLQPPPSSPVPGGPPPWLASQRAVAAESFWRWVSHCPLASSGARPGRMRPTPVRWLQPGPWRRAANWPDPWVQWPAPLRQAAAWSMADGSVYACWPGQWNPLRTWAARLPSGLASIVVMLSLAFTLLRWPSRRSSQEQPTRRMPSRPPVALTALTAALAFRALTPWTLL